MNELIPRILLALVVTTLCAGASAEPLTLAQTLDLARAHNPTLHAAALDFQASTASVDIERGRFAPVLSVNASVGYDDANPQKAVVKDQQSLSSGAQLSFKLPTGATAVLGVNAVGAHAADVGFDDVNLSGTGNVQLTQPLLRGAGATVVEAALRRARLQRLADEVGSDAAGSEVVRDVLLAYFELWYAQRALAIEEAGKDIAARKVEQAERRVVLGDVAAREVSQLEAQLADRVTATLSARQRVAQRSFALSRLLGLGDDATLFASDAPIDLDDAVRALGPLADLEEGAPEVRRARVSVQQAEEAHRTAGQDGLARVDLQGSLSTSLAGNTAADTASATSALSAPLSGQLGVVFEAPVWGDVAANDKRRARLARDAATERLEGARAATRASTSTERDAVARAAEQEAAARRFASNAATTVRATQARYAAGDGTVLEVQVAESDLRRAELQVERIVVDHASAAARLLHLANRLTSALAQ